MSAHRISVIVIGYNVEAYIEQCISSLIRQTYPNYEIIYVDDGSSDSSADIVKRLRQGFPQMKIIQKENGGIVSARTEGVRNADGEYVCFVDGDDWVDEGMLSALSSGIAASDGTVSDIVLGKVLIQNRDGGYDPTWLPTELGSLHGDEYLRMIMEDKLVHYLCANLYRREFVLEAGYLDYPHVTLAEDLMSNAFFGLFSPKVSFVDVPVYYYRYNYSSSTRAGDKRLLEQIGVLNEMTAFFRAHDPEGQYRDLMQYQWFSYLCAYVVPRDFTEFSVKKQMASQCRGSLRGWRKNRRIMNRWVRMGKQNRLTLFVYVYLTPLAGFHERFLRVVNKLLDVVRR